MVCAVMSGAIFKVKSLAIVPALCIPHRKTGAGEAGRRHAGVAAIMEEHDKAALRETGAAAFSVPGRKYGIVFPAGYVYNILNPFASRNY